MSIKVYGFWRSIASFRIRIALKLKALPFEEVSIDILQGKQFEPGYDAVNPEHVVPTFIHDGYTLYQSLAIMEYLDEIKPSPRLLPEDVKERAYARSLALMTIADSHPLIVPRVRKHIAKTFGADTKAVEEWGAHWTRDGLATYERLLARRKPEPFALGKDVGLADICIAGQVVGAQYLKIGLDACPLVKELSDRCFKIPEFLSSHPFEQPEYKASGGQH
ncbi:maleylacetoacetate isomerase [Bradyrhizobium sp.]|uniref:maleylacetoacetate isomerase n=1 Tax=Bradyrhizobium sp. TaxID=376 RepID=UPI00262B383E|nr:maleylacetoacetate isomerase [Bradyrhizobium sp.]